MLFFLYLGVSIQSLVDQIYSENNLFQCWDEIDTFFQCFEFLGKNRGSYEKSIFNSLSSGLSHYEMSTIKHGKVTLKDPRVSMFASGHPSRFCEMLNEERLVGTNGFFSRFIILNPEHIVLSLS